MKTKLFKNVFTYLLSFLLFIVANFGLISVLRPTFASYATGVSQTEVTISNSNFNSNTSTSYPFSPNSFSASQDVSTAGVEAGVINLNDDKYKDIYSINPNSEDAYVLMINSKNSGTDFSYTTESEITLDKSSNYMFTVDVYTSNTNGIANLYLIQDDKIFTSITNISSKNNWSTYTFFIKTNDIDDIRLKIKLNAKNAGVALFDNLSCFKLSNNELTSRMSVLNSSMFNFVDESNKNLVSTIDLSNNVFSNFSLGSGLTIDGKASDSISFDGSVSTAFKIKNETVNYAKYQTSDDFLTVEQNRIYKLTVFAKTRNLSGNANLQLVQTNLEEGKEGNDSAVIKVTSNTGSSTNLTNDYQEYSFYVFGYTNKSATFKLVAGLGDSDDETLTTGELYLSRAVITNVTYSIFNSVSTGTTAEKIDLNGLSSADTSIYLTNGKFNQFEITDLTSPLPATPSSWSVKTGNGEQKYGIVNTSETEWNNLSSLNMSNLSNPNVGNLNENVLMMYNAGCDILSYTSASVSLSAKTYHRFSIRVQTQNSPAQISLITKKDDKEITLSSISTETNAGEWKTIELYLYTGCSALDVSLKVTLDSAQYAYCYLDDATYNYYGQPTEESFNQVVNSNTCVKTNLTDILTSYETGNWATPNFASAESVGNIKYGIINLNNSNIKQEVIQDEEDYIRFISLNSENKNIIGIRALEDCNYTVTSLLGLKLSGGTYYKLTVSIFTKGIQVINPDNLPNADENGNVCYGAGFSLSGFDNKFTNIVSDGIWTTYTFYINPTDDTTTYLQFSLGEASALVSGDAFFGGINLEDLGTDETAFDNLTESKYVKILKTDTTNSTEDEETSTEDTSKNKNSYSWLYILPSLIMVLAVIIAIIGLAVRNIKWKKPKKKSKNAYDRNKTVSKQVYQRKATTLREQKLNELNKELESLTSERVQFEDNYKQDIMKLRELKIKRADQSEINLLNKEMKKQQKLASNLGVRISKLESEIDFVKTDAYLNSLIKKLENEPIEDKKTDNEQN